MGPLIGPVHDRLVCPFKIECIYERLTHPLVLQFFPSRIEEPSLRARRRIIRDHVLLHATVANCGKVVAGGPNPRCKLLAEQIASPRESSESNVAVTIIFIAYQIEVVLPARDRQIRAPPILDPFV